MQQELIEMLEKVVDHVVFCNGYDQRFSSTSYGVKILEEAGELVEKAKNGAKEPAVPQGEPVAWRVSSKDEPELGFWLDEEGPSDDDMGLHYEPLYTTPAAPSRPMTDEEANAIKLTSWTDEENYGAKFCDGFNAGVNAVIDALHKKG